MNGPLPRLVVVEVDGERKATGAQLGDGGLIIQWHPESFPEGERTKEGPLSIYHDRADAEQATGGRILVEDDDGEWVEP